MPVFLGFDFGNVMTKLVVLPPFDTIASEMTSGNSPDHRRASSTSFNMPSLIQWQRDGAHRIGSAVDPTGLFDNPSTFSFMKHCLIQQRESVRLIGGRRVTVSEAAEDFVRASLENVLGRPSGVGFVAAVAVPTHSPAEYRDWLEVAFVRAGFPSVSLVEEATAAACCYGVTLRPGDHVMIVDFGGCCINVSVLTVENPRGATSTPEWREVGSARSEIGGASIDRWLEELGWDRLGPKQPAGSKGSALLKCQRAIQMVEHGEEIDVGSSSPDLNREIQARIRRDEFGAMLERRGLLSALDRTVTEALRAANQNLIQKDTIRNVLAIGGGCSLPGVVQFLENRFGKDRVLCNHPFDTVARGAVAWASGAEIFRHIQCGYSIRHVDPLSGKYEFVQVIIPGTRYPTSGPAASFSLRATREGQRDFAIAIYQDLEAGAGLHSNERSIVFDEDGILHLERREYDGVANPEHLLVEGNQPFVLHAPSPSEPGELRFKVEIEIDSGKRLLLTAQDLRTGEVAVKMGAIAALT